MSCSACVSAPQAAGVRPQALPTNCIVNAFREYAGKVYTRSSLVFGDREPISIMIGVTNILGLPVPNVEVAVYLDGVKIGSARTNWSGEAWYVFGGGIPEGTHTVKCVWAGDFWNAPCEASLTLKTVGMEKAQFTAYVDSTQASASMVESRIMDDLLTKEVGAVVTNISVDLDRSRYIMSTLLVEEPTAPAVMAGGLLWAITMFLLAIAAVLIAFAVAVYITIVYVVGQYQCGIDGKRFTTCEALREHIITEHPDTWEKIKDNFTCEQPVEWWKVLMIAGVAIAGVFAAGYIIKAFRK
jgi:hypothetical protein